MCLHTTFYPDVDVTRLTQSKKMLSLKLTNSLAFQDARTQSIRRESLLQSNTLLIYGLFLLTSSLFCAIT